MKKSIKKAQRMPVFAWFLLAFLVFWCATVLSMYLWGFSTSLKTTNQFMDDMVGFVPGWPWEWEWGNYKKSFDLFSVTIMKDGRLQTVDMVGMLANSLLYSILTPLVRLFVTWLMAYVCAVYKDKIKASHVIYDVNLIIMIIPILGNLASGLQLYMSIGLYDNWFYVIITGFNFIGATYIMFYQFVRGVAKEMREAAEIDGAGRIMIMLHIVFPLCIGIFVVMFVNGFIGAWNDYTAMVIWLPSYPSLAYGTFRFSTNTASGASWPNIQVAGSMLLMIPVLTLFIIFRDKIIGGVKIDGLK